MAAAQPLIDHDRIREWADARGAKPACVKGTGGRGDVGMIRLDFPGYSGAESLQKISWAEWFRQFDENGLALMVQDTRRGGQPSNFNKLVSRGTVAGARGRRAAAGRSQAMAADRGAGRTSAGAGRKKTTGVRRTASASAARAGGGSKKTTGTRKAATSRKTGGTQKAAAASSRATRKTPARKKTAARKTGRKK